MQVLFIITTLHAEYHEAYQKRKIEKHSETDKKIAIIKSLNTYRESILTYFMEL